MIYKLKYKQRALLVSLLAVLPVSLSAGEAIVTPPVDAGRLLQDTLPAQMAPSKSPVTVEIEAQSLSDITPGGLAVDLTALRFEGNTRFTSAELKAGLGERIYGKRYDLGGLRQLANQISQYYRDAGYSFAKAFVPVQSMQDGELVLQIVEGRYGKIEVLGEPALAEAARAYLGALDIGAVIDERTLTRVMRVLGDVPGITVSPLIQSGDSEGTGDIFVAVAPAKRYQGSMGLDNYGNRYSGEYRGQFGLTANRLLRFGDALSLQGLYSSKDLWHGSIDYSLPIGVSGLRGNVGYSHTDYDLGKGADAIGRAKVTTLGLRYPLVRSQAFNLALSGSYQHKELDDRFAEGQGQSATRADIWPLSVQFDWRDAWMGEAVTYGGLTVTSGRFSRDLRLGDDSRELTKGFTKVNLQLIRLQQLAGRYSLYTSFSGQLADVSLDSSETMSLGGANAVRAFPQGEATGSNGYVGQLELRADFDAFAPYVFADYGYISAYKDDEVRREISGAGLGLRTVFAGVDANFAVAWKTGGREQTSDPNDREPRLWFSLHYTLN